LLTSARACVCMYVCVCVCVCVYVMPGTHKKEAMLLCLYDQRVCEWALTKWEGQGWGDKSCRDTGTQTDRQPGRQTDNRQTTDRQQMDNRQRDKEKASRSSASKEWEEEMSRETREGVRYVV
jgi:cell division protein FtsN